MVICQKYCGNRVMSPQIHVFAPLLNMRRCTLCELMVLIIAKVSRSKVRLLFYAYEGPLPISVNEVIPNIYFVFVKIKLTIQ